MTFIGVLLSLICTALGVLQVVAATRRHEAEFAWVTTSSRHGKLGFEFASKPERLGQLIDEAGDRGREALRRCLEIDGLITAGYTFVALGAAGILTAASRFSLGRWVLVAGIVAALADLVEHAALGQAVAKHPELPTSAGVAAGAAAVKFLALVAGVAAFLLWPFRTWFG